MDKRIYLKEVFSECGKIFVSNDDFFEKVRLADCYGDDGQTIGHIGAEDCSIYNHYYNDELLPTFLDDYNNVHKGNEVDNVEDAIYNDSDWVSNWDDENGTFEMTKAHTYWDGHKWKSIIIEGDNHEVCLTHYEITNNEEVDKIEEILNNMKKVEGIRHDNVYTYEDYAIIADYEDWCEFMIMKPSMHREYTGRLEDLDFIW